MIDPNWGPPVWQAIMILGIFATKRYWGRDGFFTIFTILGIWLFGGVLLVTDPAVQARNAPLWVLLIGGAWFVGTAMLLVDAIARLRASGGSRP